MNFRKRSTRNILNIVLLLNNLTLEEFAAKHGFSANTVQKVVTRHWGKGTRPMGKLTINILNKLESYFHAPPQL